MNEKICKLNCEHEFCSDCIKTYIKQKTQENSGCSCPLCRECITKVSIPEKCDKIEI